MAKPSRTCSALGCKLEISAEFCLQGLCCGHYIEEAFRALDLATEQSRLNRDVDRNTLDWLLIQVDSIVAAIGGESADVDPDKHAKLLELLLGIANLNEYVRHQALAARHHV